MLNKPTLKKKKTCNRAEPCQLNKNCLASNLIYKATVKTDNTTKTQLLKTDTGTIKQASTINKKL